MLIKNHTLIPLRLCFFHAVEEVTQDGSVTDDMIARWDSAWFLPSSNSRSQMELLMQQRRRMAMQRTTHSLLLRMSLQVTSWLRGIHLPLYPGNVGNFDSSHSRWCPPRRWENWKCLLRMMETILWTRTAMVYHWRQNRTAFKAWRTNGGQSSDWMMQDPVLATLC